MLNFPTTIPELADILKMSTQDLEFLAGSVERNTYVRKIPKPNGGKRTITAPSKKLKTLLSDLDHKLLRQIQLHPLFFHRPGSSYIELIKQHLNSRCLITADIDDFYPTVTPSRVLRALRSEGLENSIAGVVTRLTTAYHSLPQGFPTSPTLAGIVLKPVGDRLAGLARASRLRMGLYADNLAISTEYDASDFEGLIKRIFLQSGFKLDKWKVMPRSARQEIMNIVVNNGLRVKADYLSKIRQEIFTLAKSKRNQPTEDVTIKLASLRGKLNHVYQVNPVQSEVLRKYARRCGVNI